MTESIILKTNPTIEFQFRNNGFEIIDKQTEKNSGFYPYNELRAIDLNNVWFPRMSKYLRFFTWILNMGVPFFPDAESYKKANLMFHFKKSKLGIWLTDTKMAENAKKIKVLLDEKTVHN